MLQTEPFLDYLLYERNYAQGTVVNYKHDVGELQAFIEQENGDLSPAEVDAKLIRQWIVSLMDRGYKASTVNRKLSSIRSYFKFLLRKGELKADPSHGLRRLKTPKRLPVFLKESEMDRLLDDVDFGEGFEGYRDRMVIEMFYATGMRLSELVGIDDKDVDFYSSVIKVLGKRNKQRLIPFGKELEESMKHYAHARDEALPGHEGAFFVGKNGRRLSRATVARIVKRNLSKVTAVKKKSPHVLRHTFATVMLNHEAELGAIKALLGHESLATTEVYTHATFEELKKVYNQAHPRA